MSQPYPHLIQNIKDWPIYKVARQKKEFKEKLIESTFDILVQKNEGKLKDLIAQCSYSEKNRVLKKPWKVDPASEKSFWLNMSKKVTSNTDCTDQESCEVLLKKIISRYVSEIMGDFKVETFRFADKFLTYFFNRLFSSYLAGSLFNFFGKRKQLHKKIHLAGYVEEARDLFNKGTVILVPTHQSNLDSILIGYALQMKAGMPAFSYGAGLNLYNYEVLAYYMNRLGAYKVDRRKKNAIYHETLFNHLKLSVQSKVNNLFFPAGGRVRDGSIEQKLKMGLLSALIQAQKSNCKQGNNHKLYVVPVILNYHFVLEAKALINEHLSRTGREKFNRRKNKQSTNFLSVISYITKLFAGKSEVTLSFGKALDVMGNQINEEGASLGKKGEVIELSDYFKMHGVFTPDFQRESVYTKLLANAIAESYQKHSMVLSSHFVAFVTFNYLLMKHKAEDIFDLLNIPLKEIQFDYEEVKELAILLQNHLLSMKENEEIFIEDQIKEEIDKLMYVGIQKLGTFHLNRPLKMSSDRKIVCKDLKLLYYYANRLKGFDFEKILSLN